MYFSKQSAVKNGSAGSWSRVAPIADTPVNTQCRRLSKLLVLTLMKKKLLGITAMQKLLGKSRFDELLAAYIEKLQGKPTLVPESDKRPAMNTAKNDFMEEYDNE